MYSSIFDDTMAYNNWTEISRAAEEGQKVLLPIGVIEEHGPHITLSSDISWSYAMCRRVKDKLNEKGCKSIIAPPFYWGVNKCTGAFPGSFSLKPETMEQVLFEIMENLKGFGFKEIYCMSYHGDAAHVRAIADAVRRVRNELETDARLVLEAMDLQLYGWNWDEDFLLVSDPAYPMEWFEEQEPSEAGLFDIHAGAFETAVMSYFWSELVDLEKAKTLKSASLDNDGLGKWLMGGEETKKVVPLGYAGNPAGYESVGRHVAEMIDLQAGDIAGRICGKK